MVEFFFLLNCGRRWKHSGGDKFFGGFAQVASGDEGVNTAHRAEKQVEPNQRCRLAACCDCLRQVT